MNHVARLVAPRGSLQRRRHVQLVPQRLGNLHRDEKNFDLDLELKGIVETCSCSANMLGTKLEVKMKKAETGSWAKLDIPKKMAKVEKIEAPKEEAIVDALDLDELDLTPTKMQLSEEAKMKVY